MSGSQPQQPQQPQQPLSPQQQSVLPPWDEKRGLKTERRSSSKLSLAVDSRRSVPCMGSPPRQPKLLATTCLPPSSPPPAAASAFDRLIA